MGTVTVRPNSTPYDDGFTIVGGAGSRHAALSDDSDATYVEHTNADYEDVLWQGFPAPSLPGGAALRSYRLRARLRTSSGYRYDSKVGFLIAKGGTTPNSRAVPTQDTIVNEREIAVNWTSIQTVSVAEGNDPDVSGSLFARIKDLDTIQGIDFIALYLDAIYAAKPVTDAVAPTGTVVDTNIPTAQWVNTFDPDGGAQTHYHMKLYDGDTHGAFGSVNPDVTTPYANSSIVASSATAAAVPEALPNDTWRLYVRTAQTVDAELHWSDWDFIDFTMNTPSPGVPDITLTPQPDDARIRIDLDDTAGAVATTAFQIQYLRDNVWHSLRTPSEEGFKDGKGIVPLVGGVGRAYDLDAPNGEVRYYRVRAIGNPLAYSDWVEGSAVWSGASWVFKHPTKPYLNVTIPRARVVSQPGYTRGARQGFFHPIGAAYAIGITDTRGGDVGEISLELETESEQLEFTALLEEGTPILVQAPQTDAWRDRWVIFGDDARTRLVDKLAVEDMVTALNWTEVEPVAESVLPVAWPTE